MVLLLPLPWFLPLVGWETVLPYRKKDPWRYIKILLDALLFYFRESWDGGERGKVAGGRYKSQAQLLVVWGEKLLTEQRRSDFFSFLDLTSYA